MRLTGRPWHALAVLGLVMVMIYARSVSYGWAYDDSTWLPMQQAPTLFSVGYLPVWALSAALAGPGAFHAGLIGVHLLNGILFFVLLRRWVAPWAAVLAVGLFWLHPLQVGAVAYLSGGREALLAAYLLAGLLALLRPSVGAFLGALACLWCAFTMKPSAAALVVLLPLTVIVDRAIWSGWLSWGLGFVGSCGAGYWMGMLGGRVDLGLPHAGEVLGAIGALLARVVVPAGLTPLHTWTRFGAWPVDLGLVLGAVALVALAVWAAKQGQPWPALVVSVLLIGLGARILIKDAPPLQEPHTYLPFLVIWAALGAVGRRWLQGGMTDAGISENAL